MSRKGSLSNLNNQEFVHVQALRISANNLLGLINFLVDGGMGQDSRLVTYHLLHYCPTTQHYTRTDDRQFVYKEQSVFCFPPQIFSRKSRITHHSWTVISPGECLLKFKKPFVVLLIHFTFVLKHSFTHTYTCTQKITKREK